MPIFCFSDSSSSFLAERASALCRAQVENLQEASDLLAVPFHIGLGSLREATFARNSEVMNRIRHWLFDE